MCVKFVCVCIFLCVLLCSSPDNAVNIWSAEFGVVFLLKSSFVVAAAIKLCMVFLILPSIGCPAKAIMSMGKSIVSIDGFLFSEFCVCGFLISKNVILVFIGGFIAFVKFVRVYLHIESPNDASCNAPCVTAIISSPFSNCVFLYVSCSGIFPSIGNAHFFWCIDVKGIYVSSVSFSHISVINLHGMLGAFLRVFDG